MRPATSWSGRSAIAFVTAARNAGRGSTPVRPSSGRSGSRLHATSARVTDSAVHRGAWLRPIPFVDDLLERTENGRIELATDVAAHDVERVVVRERALEASVGRQHVVDVGDAHDAGGERNPLAGESVRIARAVPALVMAFHDRAYVPRKVDGSQHLRAGTRVPPNERPFFLRQPARLVQQLRRDDSLPMSCSSAPTRYQNTVGPATPM